MRTRSLLAVGLATCVPTAALAVNAEAGSTSPSRTVVLKGIAFGPKTTKIKRGQSVTFKWQDQDTNHNITYLSGKRFKGASTRSTGSYRVTFKKAGTYLYQCTLHLGMKGAIVVK